MSHVHVTSCRDFFQDKPAKFSERATTGGADLRLIADVATTFLGSRVAQACLCCCFNFSLLLLCGQGFQSVPARRRIPAGKRAESKQ